MDFNINVAIETALAKKTDLEREEEQRFQAEQAAKLQLPTPLQIRETLGKRIAATAERELEQQQADTTYDRLAEGLALQGHYNRALEVVKSPALKSLYERIVTASQNTTPCSCPKRQNGQETTFLQDTILFEDKMLHLYKCIVCNTLRC